MRELPDADQLDAGETFYPLHVRICSQCLLVQLPAYVPPEDIFERLRLLLVVLGLLGRGTPSASSRTRSSGWVSGRTRSSSRWRATTATCCSTASPAASGRSGSSRPPTSPRWPGHEGCRPRSSSSERTRGPRSPLRTARADLVVANNVFAHVPDIVDFSRGCARWSPTAGSVSIEIPHLLRLIEGNEYDTIYHEHYSYLSLLTTQRVLAEAGLTVVDVEQLASHGGSLRTWSRPSETRR